jgi:methylmalonyl-CoA/ethylmalonyl-CoA epimerase
MAKIRHIAITTEKPEAAAAFYQKAFDMQEIARNDRQVLLSDGYINLTILKWKTQQDQDVGPDGPNYSGIHHIGFQVDDLDATSNKLGAGGGELLSARDRVAGRGGDRYFRTRLGRLGIGIGRMKNARTKHTAPADLPV